MRSAIYIGTVPANEPCPQTGVDPFSEQLAAARRFKKLLEKKFPAPGRGCKLVVRTASHDFGDYCYVEAVFDDKHPQAVNWALKVEAEAPLNWED